MTFASHFGKLEKALKKSEYSFFLRDLQIR